MKASISEVVFGQLADGSEVKKFTLRNSKGTLATFTNYGAAWIGFKRIQDASSLVLGCETLDAFVNQKAFLGSTVGRYANRIKNGKFELNGKTIQVDVNAPPHHLHGGKDGFSHKIWDSRIQLVDDVEPTLTLKYHSADGEAGFPGNVNTTVTVVLTDDDRVQFNYHATTDQPTILNLTNHVYFNLNGQTSGSLKDHEFKLESTQFLDADEDAIPNGQIVDAGQTVFDLSDWTEIAEHLANMTNARMVRAGGYDHCFCYENDKQLKLLASAKSKTNNVHLECFSTLPGMQFYSGNFLGGTPLNDQDRYQTHGAFCLEPGYWTDSPNQSHFPDCTIDPDNGYSAIIEYSFKAMDS
jgi:aldose 1-epimerase